MMRTPGGITSGKGSNMKEHARRIWPANSPRGCKANGCVWRRNAWSGKERKPGTSTISCGNAGIANGNCGNGRREPDRIGGKTEKAESTRDARRRRRPEGPGLNGKPGSGYIRHIDHAIQDGGINKTAFENPVLIRLSLQPQVQCAGYVWPAGVCRPQNSPHAAQDLKLAVN